MPRQKYSSSLRADEWRNGKFESGENGTATAARARAQMAHNRAWTGYESDGNETSAGKNKN